MTPRALERALFPITVALAVGIWLAFAFELLYEWCCAVGRGLRDAW